MGFAFDAAAGGLVDLFAVFGDGEAFFEVGFELEAGVAFEAFF